MKSILNERSAATAESIERAEIPSPERTHSISREEARTRSDGMVGWLLGQICELGGVPGAWGRSVAGCGRAVLPGEASCCCSSVDSSFAIGVHALGMAQEETMGCLLTGKFRDPYGDQLLPNLPSWVRKDLSLVPRSQK